MSTEWKFETQQIHAGQTPDAETGARALRAVMDEIMLNLMYDLPDFAGEGVEFILDGDAVDNPDRKLADLRVARNKSA